MGITDLEEACLFGREKELKGNRKGRKRSYVKQDGSIGEEQKMDSALTKYRVKGLSKGAE